MMSDKSEIKYKSQIDNIGFDKNKAGSTNNNLNVNEDSPSEAENGGNLVSGSGDMKSGGINSGSVIPVESRVTKLSKGMHLAGVTERFKPPLGIVVLNTINLLVLSVTAILLVNLPKKADEVKEQRNSLVSSITSSDIQNVRKEIELYKDKTSRLKSFFPDDSGLIDFVKEVEEIKEGGVLTGFSFANKEVVKDATGYYGIPIVLQFTGSWPDISRDVEQFEKLPYLVRPIKVESTTSLDGDGKNVVNFKYGFFLYVNESFGKD